MSKYFFCNLAEDLILLSKVLELSVEGLGTLAVILRMTYAEDFDSFDVELLDLSKPAGSKIREARTYNFCDLPLLSEPEVRLALDRFAEAFDIVQRMGVERPQRRTRPNNDDQPSFSSDW